MSRVIPVIATTPAYEAIARATAARWGLPFEVNSDAPLRLLCGPDGLALQPFGDDAPGPVRVDFVGGAVAHRRKFGGGRGQPLVKAVGMKSGVTPTLIDATAGLGRDAFVLASLGCRVTLLERSPVVAALLEDGLRRAAADAEVAPIVARMHLVQGDAADLLSPLQADVVYLDPMYPHRESSALVKKEMRLLQQLLGADDDADRLLAAALCSATGRVVVKRPDYAAPLAGQPPTVHYTTKNHRFDVYVIKALRSP